VSSLIRRIQIGSKLAKSYMGRGQQLGVKNPKDKSLLARQKRDAKWGRKS
jgi:hypothetical protein